MIQTAPNVKVIPAVINPLESTNKYNQLRVAAYCRGSTDQEEQQNSYNVQIMYYTDLINRKKEWTLAGIFADATVIIGLKQNPTHGRRFSPIFFA